jgi:hypothetical protein
MGMDYTEHGLTTLYEFMGDFVVYRNLNPADARLPRFAEVQAPLGLENTGLPRKAEPAYGQVVAALLQQARALEEPQTKIQRVLYIGDTHMNDGTAFRNICAAGDWPGWAFIGRDAPEQPPQTQIEGRVYLANRWSLLARFLQFVEEQGFALDPATAIVIDLDKTVLGARGRNDRVIDQARMEGVEHTVAHLLGPQFDQAAFRSAYDELNMQTYHTFTADNQDYLAYICLMLGAGLFELEGLVHGIESGTMESFAQFLEEAQLRRSELQTTGLLPVHDDVWHNVQAGDPTPFKPFRRNEYLTTIARFGTAPYTTVAELLQQRICITQEVRTASLELRERGALIFGVSDKPDEASVPTPEQSQAGMEPLHRLETVAVGEGLSGPLSREE